MKLKKELEDTRIMPLKSAPLTQAAVRRMIKESIDAAIAAEWERQANDGYNASRSGQARGQVNASVVRECTFAGFMKCNPDNLCDKKVKFAAATLRGHVLTWWNSKVAILGLDVANQIGWIEMKKLTRIEFCPAEELQRMENELWNLKNNQKQGNTQAMTTAPNEGKVSSGSLPDAKPQGLNVVTGTFLLNNRYASVLSDLGSDRSFVDTRFSSMLDINPIKIATNYEVEFGDVRIVSTDTILKGCTLNLVNHLFEIDLMTVELEKGCVLVCDSEAPKVRLIVLITTRVRSVYQNATRVRVVFIKHNKGAFDGHNPRQG
nr:reverse transcriptase domain-containing protein [Tanacetum cinerariifolium]